MFIAFEGIDAAGKSTVARSLCQRLRGAGHADVRLWRKSDQPLVGGLVDPRVHRLRNLIWGHPGGVARTDRFGAPYHLYLHAAWFAVQHRLHVEPLRRCPGAVGVVDGWYHRSAVKTALRGGVGVDWALSVFEPIGAPDVTVLLDVDPATAWDRRAGTFSPWELGRWDGHTGPAREAFCAYQGAVGEQLRQLAERFGWPVVAPAASWPEQRVLDEVYARVAERLPHPHQDRQIGS
jgi:dTMP kinase